LGKDYLSHPGSCGRAIPPVTDVAIIDEDWNFIEEPKAVGEIVIKSPANMVGYWMNQEATDEVFNDDGWFKSGDLGYIDDGFVYIVDRVKIWLSEVEKIFPASRLRQQFMHIHQFRKQQYLVSQKSASVKLCVLQYA
jgi:long-subunit acyl-CoA synthetase (AMP-forming)